MSSHPQGAQGWAALPPSLPPPPGLSPFHFRIGRKASTLIQMLLFALVGLGTAFVPSFDLYLVMRFAVATAVAGYAITNSSLRECQTLKPPATG